jgi:four helix bundle protein
MQNLIADSKFDRVTNDQLPRASFSIMLNIAEGCSRLCKKDRKNFMVIARGSAFECAAILEFLYEVSKIDKDTYTGYVSGLEEISKMFFALIRKLENN